MIGKTITQYKILEKLGGGGMGVVYKAEDSMLKRTVALKFLPPELSCDEECKEGFVHEAQAVSALDHNNICTIYELSETTDGQLFIVMAYYEGETLENRIRRSPLPLEEAIEIAIQVTQGLARVHEANIIHCDIKPANIIITDRSEVKIVNFGLSKTAKRTKLTKSGTRSGTADYMSPEQINGKEADVRSDIWALGIVLCEMIAGQVPFKGDYEQVVTYSIVNEHPELLTMLRPGVPVALELLVLKCLEKESNNRSQTVHEIAEDLRWILECIGTGKTTSKRDTTCKVKAVLPQSSAQLFLLLQAIQPSNHAIHPKCPTTVHICPTSVSESPPMLSKL